MKRGTTLLGHAALMQELEELLGVKVDVVSDRSLRERVRDRIPEEFKLKVLTLDEAIKQFQ